MKNKKLIVAICMLLISAVSLSTASYAWFASNNIVTGNEVTLKATTASNIWVNLGGTPDDVANLTATSTAVATIDEIADSWTTNFDFGFSTELKKMNCASTSDIADNTKWYKATKVNSASAAIPDSEIDDSTKYTALTATFGQDISDDTYYYAFAKVIYLTTTTAANQTVTITTTLGDDNALNQAIRVGFVNKLTAGATKAIYGAEEALPATGVSTNAGSDPKAAGAITLTLPAADLSGDAPEYTVVPLVIYVWIEGESASAITANAGQEFTVELTFTAVSAG